jgi:hypothetical protein
MSLPEAFAKYYKSMNPQRESQKGTDFGYQSDLQHPCSEDSQA